MDITNEISEPLIFNQKEIRRIWYQRQWYFSIIDIVEVLAETPAPKTYWAKMKTRDVELNQLFPIWEQLKFKAKDGDEFIK